MRRDTFLSLDVVLRLKIFRSFMLPFLSNLSACKLLTNERFYRSTGSIHKNGGVVKAFILHDKFPVFPKLVASFLGVESTKNGHSLGGDVPTSCESKKVLNSLRHHHGVGIVGGEA